MSVQFKPCPGCARHVKQGDASCPFCGAKVCVGPCAPPAVPGRMSRAALFAAGAVGVAVASTDCYPTAQSDYGGPVFFPIDSGFYTADASVSDGASGTEPDAGDDAAAADASTAVDAPSSSSQDATSAADTGTKEDATSAPDTGPKTDD